MIGSLCLTVLFNGRTVAQHHAQRGAALGGIVGAITGGVIGDHNDKAGVGALVGGVLGTVTGAVIGDARDKEEQMARAYHYRRAVVQAQQAASVADVISMSGSGLSDAVIVNQISQRGVRNRLDVRGIILLHDQGVSDTVIRAMQQAAVGGPATYIARPVPAPRPVLVERYYQPAPLYIAPQPRYYRYPRHHHHHAASWGIALGW